MEKYNDTPVKLMLYPAILFLLVGMTLGVYIALNGFIFSDYFSGEYIHFGRIRPVHVGTVTLLWLLSADLGLFFFFIPRLCGVPLWSVKLAYVSIGLWWLSLIPGVGSYPFGTNYGWEYAELPNSLGGVFPVKPILMIAWALMVVNFFMTIATRIYKKMYVSLWYAMGTLIWTTFTLFVGSYLIMMVPQGISRVNTSWFYIHNLVGLIYTPMGLATAYYFLPKISKIPIYSHRLSMIGFWSVAFVYAWVGTHHMLHGPISQWLQTVAIIFSIWLFIPVWTVVLNLHATLKDNWEKYTESAPIRFIIMGTTFYLITCVQGPIMSLRNVAEITSKTDWIIGHSHISLYATFTFFAIAGIYYTIPAIVKKPLWSNKLANWHFALSAWGTIPFIFSLWVGGFLQGMMWASWADGSSYAEFHNNYVNFPFVDTITEMRPWWILRALGGMLILFSNMLFVVNMFNTVLFAPVEVIEISPKEIPSI